MDPFLILAKACIVHIAPSDPMTSIVQQSTSLVSCQSFFLNSHDKIDLVSNSVSWEAKIDINSWQT